MNTNITSIRLVTAIICMLALIGLYMVHEAYADTHEDNIAFKETQMQEKFNNINMSDYTSHEEQMAKIQRTLDYLKDWGWRGYR